MAYIKTHSAKRKAFTEGMFCLFIGLMLGYMTFSQWNDPTINSAQYIATRFIFIFTGFLSIVLIISFFSRLYAIFKYKSDWYLHIDSDVLKLSSPDQSEAESFTYDMIDVKKFEQEEYEHGGDIDYRWNMYIDGNGGIKKIELDLGPFSIEEAVEHIQTMNLQHISFEPKEEKTSFKNQVWDFIKGITYLGFAVILGILFILLLFSLARGPEVFSNTLGFIIDVIKTSLSL